MDFDKLDPALVRVWRDRQDRWRLERHVARWGVILPEDEGAVLVRVMLQIAPGAELAGVAARLGMRVSSGDFDGMRHAVVPLDAVEELSESGAVTHVALAARRRFKLMDAARAVHLPEFRSVTGATGKGVLIGVIDSGIDMSHPAFRGRVLAVWDQEAVQDDVDAMYPQKLLVGQDLVGSTDEDGHGTHVASIAAGHGCVAGVAPDADLIVVKCDGTDPNIMEAVRFIVRNANERPVVVNLSLGAHCDPHDGTDTLSAFLDEVSGPGRIVCCAAGNEGDLQIHARVPAARAKRQMLRQLEFEVPPQDDTFNTRSVEIHGWYTPTDEIAVAVQHRSGDRTPFVERHPRGAAPAPAHGVGGVEVSIVVQRASGGVAHFSVELTPNSPGPFSPKRDPLVGSWRLLLRARHRHPIDVWVEDSVDEDDADAPTEFEGKYVARSMRVGSPGAAKRAVTVANFTTRREWTNQAGQPCGFDDLVVGRVAPDSSDGPLRDGSPKPDIAAPGSMIVAARSAQSDADERLDISPTHRIMGGTSMATPFVAGVVALMLEHQPGLSPEEIKTLLSAGAMRIRGAVRDTAGPGLVRLHDGGAVKVRRNGRSRSRRRASSHTT